MNESKHDFRGVKLFRRVVSAFLVLFIASFQVLSPVYASVNVREVSFSDSYPAISAENVSIQSAAKQPQDAALDFLTNDSPLSKPDEEIILKTAERVDYDEALAQVTYDYAAANILSAPPTEEQLLRAADLNVEHAILIVDGEAVFLTTGRQGEILLHPAAYEILERAAAENRTTMIVHNHPSGQNPLPSRQDIASAAALGGNISYFTYGYDAQGNLSVYEYNSDGVINSAPYDASYLSERIAVEYHPSESTKDVRDLLSEFIYAVDQYNYSQDNPVELLSMGVTVFPGHPVLGTFASSSPAATLSLQQSSTELFRMDYDVTLNGSFAGVFMNFGADTPADLSGFAQFTFEMRTNNIWGFSQIKIEFIDTDNNVADVFVEGLDLNFQEVNVPLAFLTGVDLSIIKQIVFVVDSALADTVPVGFFEIKAGGLDYDPSITAVSNPDDFNITLLPVKIGGERVTATAFSSGDGTVTAIERKSSTEVEITYTPTGSGSFGGIFMSYDDLNTNGIPDDETINLDLLYPGGMVIQLDNGGTGITQAVLEVSDKFGNVDKVILEGIQSFGKKWVIDPDDFDKIDSSKVAIISIVIPGNTAGKLNVNWGKFAGAPILFPVNNPDNFTITPLPVNLNGDRLSVIPFTPGNNSAFVEVDLANTTGVQVVYDGSNANSFGGIFMTYDDFETVGIPEEETINVRNLYPDPNGMVFQLDNGGSSVDTIFLEFQDRFGVVATLEIRDIQSFGKEWSVSQDLMDELEDAYGIDMTKISTISFVFRGQAIDDTINLVWGDFDYTTEIQPNVPSEEPLTDLPLLDNNERPSIVSFVKNDGSTGSISNLGEGFATINFTGANTTSYGGAFIDYDIFGTGEIETFDFEDAFPSGIVLQLDSANAGSVLMELTDITGARDNVRLIDILGFGQKYRIVKNDFFNIDFTQIKTISFVFEGQVNQSLNVVWGPFDSTAEIIPADPATLITDLPLIQSTGERVSVAGFATQDGTIAAVSNVGEGFFTLAYDGAVSTSFGGVALNYGADVFDFDAEFPGGMAFQIDSPDVTGVFVELTDANDKRDRVKLKNIVAFGQKYLIQKDDFFNLDFTQIKTIAFLFEGSSNGTINVAWGPFDATAEIASVDPLTPITELPLIDGERVAVGTFASADGTTAVTSNLGETFVTVSYTGTQTTSFGGLVLDYTGDEFDFDAEFPGGIVFQVDSPNVTSVLFELTDISGKRDTVRLKEVAGFGKKYLISKDDFFNLDFTQIQKLAIVFEGTGVKTVNVEWGLFDATAEIQPTDSAALITDLPLLNNGFRNELKTFAVNDGSTVVLSNLGANFATINYNGPATTSYGGAVVEYLGLDTFDFDTEFPGGMVMQVDSPLGAKQISNVLLELTDGTGKRDSVRLMGIGEFGNKYLVQKDDFFNLDFTQITKIAFVFEGQGEKEMNLVWGPFAATPNAIETADGVTDLSGYNPSIGELEPCSLPGLNPCTTGTLATTDLTQTSDSHFEFDFNLSNGSDVAFRRFAGTVITLGSVFDATVNDLVFGFKGTFDTGEKIKIDIIDQSGDKVTVNVNNLSDAVFKNYKITGNLLNDAGIPGFNANQIKTIAIVVDPTTAGSNTATGNIEVNTAGLPFTPVEPGDDFDSDLHTSLPNRPVLSAGGSNTIANRIPGFITQTQQSDEAYEFIYDLIGSQTAFTFSQIGFGNAGQPLPPEVILGINGPLGIDLKVEIEDADGDKVIQILSMQGEFKNYSIDLSDATVPAEFDRSRVRFITLVVDRGLANGNNRDTIQVRTKGLQYTPVLSGDDFDSGLHTLLPNRPGLAFFGANTIPNREPGYITPDHQSSTDYEFIYDLGGSQTSFTVNQINFDNDGESLPANFVLGVEGPAGSQLKVEFVDVGGDKATFILNLAGALKNYTMDLGSALLPPEFDRTQVKSINLVMDRALAKGADRATVKVRTAGLDYLPIIQPLMLDAEEHTVLEKTPTLLHAGGNTIPLRTPGFITPTQFSNKNYEFIYDIRGSQTAFAFSQISFNNGSVSIPGNLVLGLKGPDEIRVKVEVEDVDGDKVQFLLEMTGAMQNYVMSMTGDHVPDDFDSDQIRFITLVIDRGLTKGIDRDTIEVQTAGLDFKKLLNGTAFDESLLTTHTNNPSVVSTGSNTVIGKVPGAITLEPVSSSEFKYAFDLNVSTTAFAFTTISNGNFDNNNVFQGTAGSLPENFIIAARGGEGSQTLVEIVDTNRNKAKFVLNLRPAYQNYTLQLSEENVPPGFDRTSIAQVIFVQDRNSLTSNLLELVKVQTKGLAFTPPALLPAPLLAVKNDLIAKGLDFFKLGVGIDADTRFPYDAINDNGVIENTSKFTQPTLIGFYLQMLGEGLNGRLDLGLSEDDLLTEMEIISAKLLELQSSLGWKGLLPFIHLADINGNPDVFASPGGSIGIGDNLNLIQSLATVIGALQKAGLSGASLTRANNIIDDFDLFTDNQEEGYADSVHPIFGLFHAAYNTNTATFDSFLDRTATEFRGGIAFATVRYDSVDDSVWDNLVTMTRDYIDRNGKNITNLATFDGSAFQTFWPLLRDKELDFISFRNLHYNHFVTQADFAAKFRIPGFLSAAEIPEDNAYVGDLGMRDVSEFPFQELLTDVGSTYALASAYMVAPQKTLEWLKAIGDQLPATLGTYGFLDSARSNTEVAKRHLAIDLASTVLGLAGFGPDTFELYLRSRGMELDYNLLYDQLDNELNIKKTGTGIITAPEFPDRSFSVFRNSLLPPSTINNFPVDTSILNGVHFQYNALQDGFGGETFVLDQTYDASANQLMIQYSVIDSPKKLKIELLDGVNNKLFETNVAVVDSTPGLSVAKLVINLPNQTLLNNVAKVNVVIDQNDTLDVSGDFYLHSMVFQHLPSSQNLVPNPALNSGNVSVVPDTPFTHLITSDSASSILRLAVDETQLNFDLTGDVFAGVSVNFDPTNTTSGTDLSGFTKIVFGMNTDKADRIKVEITDDDGKTAIYYVTGIDTTRRYYEFLTGILAQSIDVTRVKTINFVVDNTTVEAGNEIGSFELELDGLLFP